jgi:murein DD-endopeptidase MepM/ murein hydrolase activator NlpD
MARRGDEPGERRVTEYRIVATLDPGGVTQGSAKVKQDLRGVDTAANSTKRNLQQAFASDRTISSLIDKMEALDKTMGDLNRTSSAIVSSNGTVAASLDQIAAAGIRAGDGARKAGEGAQQGARGQGSLEAATRRVLQAVDQEAAEIARLNGLLGEAKMLLDRGAISSEQFARVQALVDQGVKRSTVSIGQQRAGYTQLGFQVQDITQTLALGINPLVVLAQQGGQTASALSMALGEGGTAGKVATFMAGPWGSLILAGVTVVGMLGFKALTAGNELSNMTNQLREDARQSELTRRAHEAFNATLEGMIANSRRLNDELSRTVSTQRQVEIGQLAAAGRNVADLRNQADDYRRQIAQRTHELETLESMRGRMMREGGAEANEAGISAKRAELVTLNQQLADAMAGIARAEQNVRMAEQPLIQRDVESSLDRRTAATERYTRALGNLNTQLRIGAGHQATVNMFGANGQISQQSVTGISREQYQAELTRITRERDAAIRAAQEAESEARRQHQDLLRPSAGPVLSQFGASRAGVPLNGRLVPGRRHEGVDIAGRLGDPVLAPEAGTATVRNAPGGLGLYVEIRADSGARDLLAHLSGARVGSGAVGQQARVEAGQLIGLIGNSGNARGGPTHLHWQRQASAHAAWTDPMRSVGSSGAASTAQQAQREADRTREQQGDFVQQVVDEAAGQGRGNQAETLASNIERRLADYRRRFNEAMSPADEARVRGALTDASTREVAQRFEDAYVRPMQRFEQLQGKTGLDREVLNAQLEETVRIGRELTPIEAQQIDHALRRSDAMSREADILAQIRQPMTEYQATLAALNALLDKGAISQTQFNGRVAQLGESARSALGSVPGNDPSTGVSYADLAARANSEAQRDTQLAELETQRQRLLDMGINYDRLVEAARQAHVDRLREIDRRRRDTELGAAQELFGSLAEITKAGLGEQSAIYKAAFIAEKAVAIARSIIAIQEGIAQALKLGFPAGIVAAASVAAQGASIIANLVAVKATFAKGGYTGSGGRDELVGGVHGQEFVVNADATSRHRALLEAVNSGTLSARSRSASNDNMLGGRGGDSYSLSFGDVVVNPSAGMTAADGRSIGRDVKDQLRQLVDDRINEAKRDGGALTRTRQSAMSGG